MDSFLLPLPPDAPLALSHIYHMVRPHRPRLQPSNRFLSPLLLFLLNSTFFILSSAFALSLGSIHPVILAHISSSHHLEYAITTVTYVGYATVLSLACVILCAFKYFPRKPARRSRCHISRMRKDRIHRLWIKLRKPQFLQDQLSSVIGRNLVPVFVTGVLPSTLAFCVDPDAHTVHDLYRMVSERISPAPFDSTLFNLFNYSFQPSPLPLHRMLSDVGVSKNTLLHSRVRVQGGTPDGQRNADSEAALIAEIVRQIRGGQQNIPAPFSPTQVSQAVPAIRPYSGIQPRGQGLLSLPGSASAGSSTATSAGPSLTIPSIPIPASGNSTGLRGIPGPSTFASHSTNQRRVEAAARHAPAPRRRGRTAAQAPPSLGRSPRTTVLNQDPISINIVVLLYPPLEHGPDRPSQSHPVAHYRRLTQWISHLLSLSRALLWNDVDVNTRIIDLIARATREFEAAPLEARFTYPPGASMSSPNLPLALLGPFGRGREIGVPPTRRLRYIVPSVDVTLQDVLSRPQATLIGASRELCWDATRRNTFILRTVPIIPTMQCFHPNGVVDFDEQYCTGECVWTGFEGDHYSEPPRAPTPSESITTIADDDERSLFAPPPSPDAPSHGSLLQPRQLQHATRPMTQLWSEPFIEATPNLPTITTTASLAPAIGSYAVNPSFPNPNPLQFVPPHLEISASTKRDAAEELEYIIGRCWGDGDAAMLLTPMRDFRLTPNNGRSSHGEGVEREVLQELVDLRITPSHIVQQAFGDSLIFNPTTDDLRVPSTPSQLKEAYILGAILSLSIARLGYLPQRFSPLQWLMAINNGDVRCISREMLEHFAPDLLTVIDSLRAAGPDGSLEDLRMHFAIHVDLDIGRLQHRDESMHGALEELTLRRSLFRGMSFDHPQSQAFIAGVQLRCDNGFAFADLVHAFSGGSASLLLQSIEGRIRSFADLSLILDVIEPSSIPTRSLRSIPGYESATYGQFLTQFLQQTGFPQPQLAEGLRSVAGITDEEVEDPAFRSRSFHQAATNRELIMAQSRIKVTFVGTSNTEGLSTISVATRRNMAQGETILWRTCLGCVYIPTPVILGFLQDSYSATTAFQSAEQAINHWLLSQVVTACRGGIGGTA